MPTVFTDTRPTVLDAVLNVRKEADWTSHDVVAKLRRCARGARVGHAGTLDPAAVGVLPVLLGRATRIAEYLVGWDKEYTAMLRLGETTDTLDATGTVLVRRSTDHLTPEAIHSVMARFMGRVRQVPPMFSAVKVAGVPLYKSARAGRTVQREPREVQVHRLEVLEISGRDVWLRLVCSKGTYVRTLCADIGEALGVGGHLAALERTRVGPLMVAHALPVAAWCDWLRHPETTATMATHLLSLDDALGSLPVVTVSAEAAARALHGVLVPATAIVRERSSAVEQFQPGQSVRIKDLEGRLLAIGILPEEPTGCERLPQIKIAKVFEPTL